MRYSEIKEQNEVTYAFFGKVKNKVEFSASSYSNKKAEVYRYTQYFEETRQFSSPQKALEYFAKEVETMKEQERLDEQNSIKDHFIFGDY